MLFNIFILLLSKLPDLITFPELLIIYINQLFYVFKLKKFIDIVIF